MDRLHVLLASLLKSLQDVLLAYSKHLLYFSEENICWRQVFQQFMVTFIGVLLNKFNLYLFKL